jgi:hypothetical protein
MKSKLAKAKSLISSAERPIFFFDDDVDGLCSFLVLYRMMRAGKGHIMKTKPVVEHHLLRNVQDYNADLVVILDMPNVDPGFVDECPVPIIWLDHHEPASYAGEALYINPLEHNKQAYPTSYWAYLIAEDEENLWRAETGVISDWQIVPPLHEEAQERLASLVPKGHTKPQEFLFDSPIGNLIKIFMFNLKGSSSDVRKSINTLTRIETAEEILEQKTPAGKFIYKRYLNLVSEYDKLLSDITSKEYPGSIVLYRYQDILWM